MQNDAAVVPARRRADAEERIDLRRGRCGAVGRTGPAGRRMARDMSAPGIGRLRRRAGLRIGEAVAGGNIHHHERIERDLEPPRLQLGDEVRDARVGRRAAEGRPPADRRHQMRRRARQSGNRPDDRMRRLAQHLDARLHLARRRRADRSRTRPRRSRRVRGWDRRPAGRRATPRRPTAACATWRFSVRDVPRPTTRTTVGRLIAELRGARDQRHRADHLLEPSDRAHHFERQAAECGCRSPRAAAARTPHRRGRDRRALRPSLATISASGVLRLRCRHRRDGGRR